jgi:tetratricopeptide (TPR) repeat protein
MDDEQPQPRIIDFGIAKALNTANSSSDYTVHGECLGTPAYMSPEQAMSTSGSSDVRSDIYSLGVVLYELLVGETPRAHLQLKTGDFAWKTPAFWQTAIIAPSKRVAQSGESAAAVACKRGCSADDLRQQLTSDLDSILLKALATDRDERYQNISELQRDLERLLAGYPVEAVGPSKLYRFRKLIWRHRWASAATGLALIAIIASSVLAILFAFRAKGAEQMASQRLNESLAFQDELQQKRDEAETASRQAFALLRIFQVEAVSNMAVARYTEPLMDALKSGDPIDPSLKADYSVPINSDVLCSPDPRLVIKGDWSWVVESNDTYVDAFSLPIEINSRDAVAVSGLNEGAQTLSELLEHNPMKTVPARLRYQTLLLEELQKKLPAQDPFLAEVLDNCGLLAIRLGEYQQAIDFLSKSGAIWNRKESYRPNALQSRLFLAEAMMLHGRRDETRDLLSDVQAGLGSLLTTPEIEQLRGFLKELQLKNR